MRPPDPRALVLVALLWACAESPASDEGATAPAAETLRGVFVDVAASSGLDFVHDNGMTGERYFVEMMGSGAALVDYDGDGDLDVFLVQGGSLGGEPEEAGSVDRLFRNELEGGALRFVEVTEESGLAAGRGYGMGVATGDVDGDGWVDLYVTNFGANRLWRGRGDGTFEDATAVWGAEDTRWSVAAVFWDYDRDGWADLYVGNYVDFQLASHEPCASELGVPNYCGPLSYDPVPDLLLHNDGGRRFSDATGTAGLAAVRGSALGAVSGDFDGDGWLDLYVANDQMPNFMWRNQGDGTFAEEAAISGSAVNGDGRPEASMGVAVADFDRDGDEDLFSSHLREETNTLFVNSGDGSFQDRSRELGIAMPSWSYTAFGTVWIDVDNDGFVDLLVVNGAVRVLAEQVAAGDPLPLRQRDQLFLRRGGPFVEASLEPESPLAHLGVSRGAAVGDIDNDGDLDVLVTENNGPVRLLRNEVGSKNAWVGLRVLDPGSGADRDALGARVTVWSAVGPQHGRVSTAGSYVSASDPRLLFGLGQAAEPVRAEVQWLGGEIETWNGLAVRRYHELRRGSGDARR